MLLFAVPRVFESPAAESSPRRAVSPDYEEMFRAHYGRVVRWLSVLGVQGGDVDDAAQEVFIIAHRRIDTLRRDASITGWLLGISRRVAATHRRTRRRLQAREDKAEPPSPAPDPEDVALRHEATLLLSAFVESLPEEQQLVFALYEIDGENATQVAELLDISPNTVHSRLRLIRDKLNRFVARERKRR